MEPELLNTARIVWKDIVFLRKEDKVLIISDRSPKTSDLKEIALALQEAAKEITPNAKAAYLEGMEMHGEEPPGSIAKIMLSSRIIVAPTSFSLTHTKAVRDAVRNGSVVITLPGIRKSTFLRAVPVDYNEMGRAGEKLKGILEGANEVVLETELGTDLRMSVSGRKVYNSYGIKREPGVGNLPAGEVEFSPLEGTSSGRIVFDLTGAPDSPTKYGMIGKINKPFAVRVERGRMTDCENKVLWKIVSSVKNGTNLAELGIGTNPSARITGSILEDEKVKGTAHIAFGTSKSIGGNVISSVHLDNVLNKPTIHVDGQTIIKSGRFLF